MAEKTKEELTKEIKVLQKRIAEFERSALDSTLANKALLDSNIFINSIVEQSSYSMWISDEKGTLIRMNKACAKLFNTSEKELNGKYNILNDNIVDEQSLMPLVKNVFEKGEAAHFELHYDTSHLRSITLENSVKLFLDVTIYPIQNAAGKTTNAVIQHVDITKRKKAEESLRESEEKYRRLFDNAPLGIFQSTPAGKVISVNNAFAQMFGYDSADDVVKNVKNVATDIFADPNRRAEILSLMIKNPKLRVFENIYRRKDGSTFIGKLNSMIVRDTDERILRIEGIIDDITELKKADEQIQALNEKFSTLTKLAPVGIYLTTPDGKCLYANPSWCKMAGQSLEEALGNGWIKGLHPDDKSLVFESWQKMVNSQGKWGMEYRFITPDGKVTTVFGLAAPQHDSAGMIISYVGVNLDITERKLVEEKLVQSRDLLVNLARMVPSVIYQYRLYPDGRSAFPYSSPGMNDIYEVRPEEVQEDATPVFGRLHPQDYDRVAKLIQESARTLKMFYCEFRVLRPRQGLRWRWSQAHPERTEDGGTLWHGIISDITDRKLMEEALQIKQQQLVEAQQLSHIGSWEYDPVTQKPVWSDEMFHIFGLEPQAEAPEYALHKKLIHPEDWERFDKAVQAAVFEGKEYSLELRILPPDKPERIIVTICKPKKAADGSVLRLFGTVQDITMRKKQEEELMKLQKIESLGLLAGGIAHDFNNILTTILGNINLIRTLTKIDAETSELLADAEKGITQATALTFQLLTFSKGGEPLIKLTSIVDIIKDAAIFVTRGSNCKVEFAVPEGIWAVKIDQGQITQVLDNIIINAKQAMPEGGKIKISVENVDVPKENAFFITEGSYVHIVIQDSGLGIAKENLNKIFDLYYTTKPKGKGLGLPMVLSIVKKHNGHVSVSSEPGKGTLVNIYLPAKKGTGFSVESITDNDTIIEGSGRVLIMDDEAEVLEILSRLLKRIGYEVGFSVSGNEAIKLYKEALSYPKPFDLVILDLTVPGGMGGKQALVELKKINADIKAIATSGYSNDNTIAEYKALGFKDFLAKPYTIALLSQIVAKALK